MIKEYEFIKTNKVYYEGVYNKDGSPKINKGLSSHILKSAIKQGLTKFITFDTESETHYFYKDKEISYDDFLKVESFDTNLVQKFYIRTIQAVFDYGRTKKRKIYINGISEYKKDRLIFSINNTITKEYIPFNVQIIYADDIIKQFIEDVIKFTTSGNNKYKEVKIFCHNAKHDWLQIEMFNYHKKFNFNLKTFNLTSPRFCIWEIERNTNIIFIDTTNYFKEKLSSIGEKIGIKKQSEKVDFKKRIIINQDFLEYGIIDSEILNIKMRDYSKLVKEYGKLGYGVPSTAYNIWKTSFMDEKIWLHKNNKLMDIERSTYYGGRTECFKLGFYTNIYGIDINSSYPYQMEKELPIEYEKSIKGNITINHYNKYKQNYLMIVECLIDSKLPIPIIPHHHKDKLIFINGEKIHKTLCQPEIDLLIELNCKIEFIQLHLYKKGYPMKRFSNYFMEMKMKGAKENNLSLKEFGKLNSNSAYGKTAERHIISEIEDCDINLIGNYLYEIPQLKKKVYYKHLAGKKIKSEKQNYDSKDGFCVIGSFITSYARCHLAKTMYKIGRENIVYVDTDSIYFINKNNIIEKSNIDLHDYKIGSWDIEEKNINMLVFGAKDYYKFKFDMTLIKQKLKGVNLKDSIQDENEQGIYYIKQWTGFGYALQYKDISHQQIVNTKKTLQRNYTKAKLINPITKNLKEYKNMEYIQAEIQHFLYSEL